MISFGSSLLLQDHFYRHARALMGADAAALAVIQVGNKKILHLVNAALWAVDLADATLDTFLMIEHGHESPPRTSFCDTSAARIYQSPCFYIHQETLS
jgi:hypothetical protein